MGFRINNNISAMVTQGNLNKTQGGLARSIERLSSGLKINRGADDAAGLTISEKLRGQIRGLNRAINNAQDGISLIQTAEGALNETAAITNRMRELAIQAQDDALTASDRLEIQKEVDQLIGEVDRISQTTEFNTKKLLDGSASALVTTDGNGLQAFQKGEAGLAAGDYTVRLALSASGTRQVQQSNILTDKGSGNLAGLSTKLSDLTSMYDSDGNNVLESPETITIRGNGEKATVNVSGDMTLEQFSAAVESKVNASIKDGGLGLSGSTFAFSAQTGQIVFEAGKEGTSGEIALSASENLLKSFGLQITTDSQSAAYTMSATSTNGSFSASSNTNSDVASGVIDGLDFKFQLASAARVDGTVAGTEAIRTGNTNIVFTIADTNSQTGSSSATPAGNRTARIAVTLTANRTFTKASITAIVNNAIQSTANGASSRPGITASFNGYDLQLTSSATGTSAKISVLANQATTDILGLRTGVSSGGSGSAALLTGALDVSGGITIGTGGDLRIQIGDGDYNSTAGTQAGGALFFQCGSTVSAVSLTTQFNNYLTTNSIKATASVNSSGRLEIRSTETGTDARLSITAANGSLAPLGLISGQNSTGSSGTAAVLIGDTNDSQKAVGFTFAAGMSISITDGNGASSGLITLADGTVTGASNSFTMSKASITAQINASALSTTDVTYAFDAGNRLDFMTRSAGKDSRMVFSTNTIAGGQTAAQQVTNGVGTLGVNFNQAVQGDGQNEFRVHVADRALNFQIGANQSQTIKFSVINTSSEALGLKGLDITNMKSATRALSSIDNAVQMISSERSKLGSLQNRLNSTINNLTVTTTNLQSTESKIRDVDVAMETVEFTRNQILLQAGTGQLAQAKALPQQALQLLG